MMSTNSILFLMITATMLLGFMMSYQRAKRHTLREPSSLHSLPRYYGYYTALWAGIPSLLLLLLWLMLENTVIDYMLSQQIPESMQAEDMSLVLNNIRRTLNSTMTNDPQMLSLVKYYQHTLSQSTLLKSVFVTTLTIIGAGFGIYRLNATFRARNAVELCIKYILLFCSFIAVITALGIVASVLFESLRFFQLVSPIEFLFGTQWSPTAEDPQFGAVPLFAGTLLISCVALFIAVPVGLMSAIFLSEYANNTIRSIAKPALELLAGIPTVVYGFFAALTVAPFFSNAVGIWLELDVSSESALAAGVVMGIMMIPFVSSLTDDALRAIPQYLRDGSLSLGATKSETIKQVLLPAALPGIVGGILLAASRAIGETMIVVMAAGLASNLTANPLEAVTTVTVQIVTLLTGDQEFDSPKTLAAFALALLLFVVTLILNMIAQKIVTYYREQYD